MSAPSVTDAGSLRFNLCRVETRRGTPHFDEAVAQLYGALVDLGHDCTVTVNQTIPGAVNVLIGSLQSVWPYCSTVLPSVRDHGFVLYQMEPLHLGRGLFRDHIDTWTDLFSRAGAIWEYSPHGMGYFAASPWAAKVHYVPPMFHRVLESFTPARNPTTDVLFYGTLSPRRVRILDRLVDHGVRPIVLKGAYAEPRDAEIRIAKVVLNIHQSNADVLETLRLAQLLANRCFCVSEASDHDPFDGGVVYAPYDRLVETCIAYLERPDERAAIAERGYAAMRRHDMVANLRAAIAKLPIAAMLGS